MKFTGMKLIILLSILSILSIFITAGCNGKNPYYSHKIQATDYARDPDLAKQKNRAAVQLLRCNKYDEAKMDLITAVDADPMYGPAHNNLGKIHYHDKEFYKAAQEFQYASKLMPKKPQPHNNLGLVYEANASGKTGSDANKKLDLAIESYQKAVELDSNNPEYLGNLARARVRRGLYDEETYDYLQKLIEIDSRDAWLSWAKTNLKFYPKFEPSPLVKTAEAK